MRYTDPRKSDWIRAISYKECVYTLPQYQEKGKVPDLTGMGLRDAMFVLDKLGMGVVAHGVGKVKYQSIAPGTLLPGGDQRIEVYLE